MTKDMLGRKPLTPVTQARELLQEQLALCRLSSESIPLESSLGRITATDIYSPENLPSHPRSTMDGFAVNAGDTFGASESMPCYLKIDGEVLMGEMPSLRLAKGICCKISTGGLLPAGSNAVVMLEHTVPVDDTLIEIIKGVGPGTNIIGIGDDIRQDNLALPKGSKLRPQDLGLLAGLGIDSVEVHRQVNLGLLSTGEEIVDFHTIPAPGKIRDINGITLSSLAIAAGCSVKNYGIVPDNSDEFFTVLQTAIDENDVVLFSGGSSVGMRDLGEQVIEELCSPGILVHGVALKPGKPIIIGFDQHKPVFGLPGHPVSAMVCFELFVLPSIETLSGVRRSPASPGPTVSATLNRNIASAPGRRDIVRVELIDADPGKGLIAQPVLGKSGAISSLSRADGYFIINESLQGLAAGNQIEVVLYQ